MLNIKLKYNLRRCPPPPTASSFCKHKWSIYVLHVEKEVVGVDLSPVTANEVTYQKVTTIGPTDAPAPGKMEQYDHDVKIVTKKRGVYLAFLDQGACVSLLRASLCKILIPSFAHKMDFAHNFPVDFF